MSRLLAAVVVLVALLSMSPDAAAQPDCSRGRNRTQADTGSAAGEALVEQAFEGIGRSVERIDEFKARVLDVIRNTLRAAGRSARGNPALLCRAIGLMNGVVARLDALQEETACGDEPCPNASRLDQLASFEPIDLQRRGIIQCWLDGFFWGELSAELYCALAIELDGLAALGVELPPRARSCCGFGFETACNAKFAFDATADEACEPYTLPPHEAAYLETRRLQCTFEL